MRTDFSPLYRSTVGFDRIFDLLDQSARLEPLTNWPPYNIEKLSEDQYRITMALAGFGPEDVELTQHGTTLVVMSTKKSSDDKAQFLHRGIAGRTFKQTFNLADHVRVTGASLENGLLAVELKREVPEQLKPRRIEIAKSGVGQGLSPDNAPQQVDHAAVERKVA